MSTPFCFECGRFDGSHSSGCTRAAVDYIAEAAARAQHAAERTALLNALYPDIDPKYDTLPEHRAEPALATPGGSTSAAEEWLAIANDIADAAPYEIPPDGETDTEITLIGAAKVAEPHGWAHLHRTETMMPGVHRSSDAAWFDAGRWSDALTGAHWYVRTAGRSHGSRWSVR